MAENPSIMAKTVHDIRDIMNALNYDDLAMHFDQEADEIDPYVVCEGVSVDVFNKYVDEEDESLPRGSMTVSRNALPHKGADATYGPMRDTLNRTPPPPPRTVSDWVTFAVEVGRSQTWESLTRAARWWVGYIGIQYILLLKVNATATELEYRQYAIVCLGTFPDPPTVSGVVRRDAPPDAVADSVAFNMRRILSIPAHDALPEGVNEAAVVNLRDVLNQVWRHI
ncbi:hypothetical protein AC1031_019614 [Aphanomyces cochlioides]|nr:hypothetical protein AC1031_019614 [Aphanomyces cochlioides]